MNFKEAIDSVLSGKPVRRPKWNKNIFLGFMTPKCQNPELTRVYKEQRERTRYYRFYEYPTFTESDLKATDWEEDKNE